MDVARSCHETDCQFFVDSDLAIPIRWYFAAPGAKLFPALQRFGNGDFASLPWPWPGPGEVQGAERKRVTGPLRLDSTARSLQAPFLVSSLGQYFLVPRLDAHLPDYAKRARRCLSIVPLSARVTPLFTCASFP